MRLSKHHGTKLEINMTPMIDVTFLLLIFFMTVNQVSKAQRERDPAAAIEGHAGPIGRGPGNQRQARRRNHRFLECSDVAAIDRDCYQRAGQRRR